MQYGSTSAAKDYIPLLSKDKEWGYLEYISYGHPLESFHYYRLACGNKITIDGIEYVEICKYDSFLKPDNAEIIAYMREEEGKVYVRYPKNTGAHHFNFFWEDFQAYDEPDFNPDISRERLIYDFSMEAGDTIELEGGMIYDDRPATLKCIETGTVTFDGVERKYLKFDKDVNLTCLFWMAYEYLVEGVGPVGNCEFTKPYRSDPTSSIISSFTQIRLLYQRELPECTDSERCFQGKMLYKPAFFDIYGICDPSVYMWASTPDERVPSTDCQKAEDLNIKHIYYGKIYCEDEVLKKVTEYNMIGQEITSYTPMTNEVTLDFGDRGKVFKVETDNCSRSFADTWFF